jgi:hypothetical protein
MARLNDDAQWIVLMGFIVSFSFFFLAMVINQSTVVGQTTAESVIEFPKSDIRDTREVAIESADSINLPVMQSDVTIISLDKMNAVVDYTIVPASPPLRPYMNIYIHYNNGVTEFNENWTAI